MSARNGPPPRRVASGRTIIPPRKNAMPQLPAVALTTMRGHSAPVHWTRAEWMRLCAHLHNENEKFHFVMGFQKDGVKKYVRSKKLPADRAISWSWMSISGEPKSRLAFVPYSANAGRSRWGGLDFDAHNREFDRARELAFAAFRVLLNEADRFAIILESSGTGGWHLWIVSPEFHDTRFWILWMRRVVSQIGAVICDGVCEIFPPDHDAAKFSKGMRAPGCWNPSNNSCSEVYWEDTRTKLREVLSGKSAEGEVLSGKSKTAALICKDLDGHFPDIEKNSPFSSPSSAFLESYLQGCAIVASATRNGKLVHLVGSVFHQLGRTIARQVAELQYDQAKVGMNATKAEHLASFEALWTGLASRWTSSLTAQERNLFASLETDHERDAFRILRSFARKAAMDGAPDFPIACENFANRLGLTRKGAGWIRDKFARLGITTKTANYVPNKFSARYAWNVEQGEAAA